MKKHLRTIPFLLSTLGLIVFSLPSNAQDQFDVSFLDRPNHKMKPTFQMTGDDFGQHTYRRMLLNSPHASSSVGLGVNGKNAVYNKEAFKYMHPEAFKINKPTATQQEYIDNAYSPKLNKGYDSTYETDTRFKSGEKFSSQSNPFDNCFSNTEIQPAATTESAKSESPRRQSSDILEISPDSGSKSGVPNFLQNTGGKTNPSFF